MAARSSWKGFLRFSLVTIPVKAFTATASGSEIKLNQIHKGCNSRINYHKVCPVHGKLSQDEIVSGYEFAKDQYVVIDPDEIAKLRSEADKSVAIDAFIAPEAIDPVYYNGKSYYLAPDGVVGNRPFALLRQGMHDMGKVAVATLVLHGKKQLGVIRPVENMLAIDFLNYDAQINKPEAYEEEVPPQELSDAESELVKTLIKGLSPKKFDLTAYKDDYTEKMTELIQAKIAGQEIVLQPAQAEPEIYNLMDALKQSLQKMGQGTVEEPAKPARRMAKSKPPAEKKPAVEKKRRKSS